MDQTVMFAIALLGVWLLLLWQRVPAMTLFFSLLSGQILSTEINGEVYSLVSGLVGVSYEDVKFALLVTPVLLTVLFLRHKVQRQKLLIEAIPMIFTVAAIAIFVYPYIPAVQAVLEEVTDHNVITYRNVIIGIATVLSLLSAWFGHHKSEHKKAGKH